MLLEICMPIECIELSEVTFSYLNYHHRSGKKRKQLTVDLCFNTWMVIVQVRKGNN